jgi:tRNA(fMet)-specific endonuclease VapC
LFYGAKKSKRRKENLEKINEFLHPFQIHSFSDSETRIYASLRAKLEKERKLIGPNDLLIHSLLDLRFPAPKAGALAARLHPGLCELQVY